jgi:uncharacterized membrane protein YkoI
MKKILSLVLVTVMVMSLSIPAFADKPAWAGNDKEERVEKELPKGLQDKAVIPYGHRKDQEVTIEAIEALIVKVEDYIDNLDMDSDDDGIEEELSVDIIDLEEAEDIALDEIDGDIVKMEFDDGEYEFEILLEGTLYKIEVDGFTKDVDVDADDDDEDYDLEDIMSYNQAKVATLAQVDEDDAIIIEVELDMEEADDDDDDDEDEEKEATYTIEVKTATKTYEIEFDAFDGDLLEFDSEANDDDDDDWRRDRDRDRDDDEGMVSAIENLIDRIEYELEKEEPKLGHFMFQLEQKFYVLQKIYGEAPEKSDYTNDLEELLDTLEDIKDDSIFNIDDEESIQDLIDEIEIKLDELEDDEIINEEEYEEFEERGKKYLDELEEVVGFEKVETLIDEIQNFVFENEFGNELGEYSQDEAIELLGLIAEAPSVNEDNLKEYYDDLKRAYRKFKMSKLVSGDYLEALEEYKTDLEQLSDGDLTEAEEDLRDDLIDSITTIQENKKMTLDTFYKIEEEALELLEETALYEKELNELIAEVKEIFLTSFDDVNQNELKDEKMILLSEYFAALTAKDEAEIQDDFEEILMDLQDAYDDFIAFLEQ